MNTHRATSSLPEGRQRVARRSRFPRSAPEAMRDEVPPSPAAAARPPRKAGRPPFPGGGSGCRHRTLLRREQHVARAQDGAGRGGRRRGEAVEAGGAMVRGARKRK